jgi:Fur family ferric uptake transcriptional regulator
MDASELLKKHGLRVTSFRTSVLALFEKRSVALDGRAIEHQLKPADRVTIYRTLRSFEDSGIIHRIPDPSGAVKFAMCLGNCDEHAHHDSHAHFHCDSCDSTLCLSNASVTPPPVQLPTGFSINALEVTVRGTCAQCQQTTDPIPSEA